MIKRILTLALAIIFVCLLTPAAFAAPIDTADGWAKDRITAAIAKGFVPADIQDNYKNVITREEFCRMAVKWIEFVLKKSISAILTEAGVIINQNAFSDTSNPDILAANALGIVNGEIAPTQTQPGVFNPRGSFTRQQAAVMIMNACKAIGANINGSPAADFADMDLASSWARQGINFARANGIIAGVTETPPYRFNPHGTFTRQESILLFNNIDPAKLPTGPAAPSGPELPPGPELPSGGGAVTVTASTIYTFKPETSGAWLFRTMNNGDNDPYLELYDSRGNLIGEDDDGAGYFNARLLVTLDAGETYSLHAASYGAFTDSYTLTVSKVGIFPGAGGSVKITGPTGYGFKPDRTGLWTIRTSDNGGSDPIVYIYFSDGDYDMSDDSGGDMNALIVLFLYAGETYHIETSFFGSASDGCTLTVSPAAALNSAGETVRINGTAGYSFTPDQSGIWELRTLNSGDCDPYMHVLDEHGDELFYSDDEGGGYDALLSVQLTAGTKYFILVGFYDDFFEYSVISSCDLSVSKK